MDLTSGLGLALGLGVIIVIALIAWRMAAGRSKPASGMPESLQQVSQARIEGDEKPASLISEQIEEMVRTELAQYPDLSGAQLDFGTAPDGALEIWFDGQQYASADLVPDERVRSAITRAVETFNR